MRRDSYTNYILDKTKAVLIFGSGIGLLLLTFYFGGLGSYQNPIYNILVYPCLIGGIILTIWGLIAINRFKFHWRGKR
jgi:hypothetical protein